MLMLAAFTLNGCYSSKSYYTPNGVSIVSANAKGQIELASSATNVAAIEMRANIGVKKDLYFSANFMTDVNGGLSDGNTYNAYEGGLIKNFIIDSTQFHQVGLFAGLGNAGNYHQIRDQQNATVNEIYLETPIRKITAQYAYTTSLEKSDMGDTIFRSMLIPRMNSQFSLGTRITNIGITPNTEADAKDYPSRDNYTFIEPFVNWKAGNGKVQVQQQVLYSIAMNANKPLVDNTLYGWGQNLEKHLFSSLQYNIGVTLKF